VAAVTTTDALPGPQPSSRKAEKPTHYKVICISLYNEDLKRLDEKVEKLKRGGLTRANRSWLIRYALDNVKVPELAQLAIEGR
jgi:hypothetical protein